MTEERSVSDSAHVYRNGGKRNGQLVRVRNARSGALLGERISVALSFGARLRGLLGRPQLLSGGGIWLEPCASIHMFFMRFAIDVVFVDNDGLVVRPIADLRPWRIASGGPRARAALEVPVGTIERSATRIGDRLEIETA